jgi:peptide deformylase
VLRPIVRYGQPGLQQPAEAVRAFDAELDRLIDDMIETMYAAPGIGLAAPQVGVPKRLCVIDLNGGKNLSDLLVLINPEFLQREGMQLEDEGCLSVPGFTATVPRPAKAVVRAMDRTGQTRVFEATGLLARAFQHEIDHLDGRLFLDRLRSLKRDMITRKIRKLQRDGKW